MVGHRILVALMVASALVVSSAACARSEEGQPASLSFVRGDSVFLASDDGSRVSLVLRGKFPLSYYEPAWSSDGRRLAVTVQRWLDDRHGESDVYVIVPGQKRTLVPGSETTAWSGSASWAPDDRRLVLVGYMFFGDPGGGGLYTASVGSQANAELTPQSEETVDAMPAWSPDGSTVAFVRTPNGTDESRLQVIQADGSGLKQVTTSAAFNPNWSPDGRHIVFDDGRHIAVIDADGRNLKYLTNHRNGGDQDPAWAPDGRTIAFVRTPDIWLMNSDGGSQRLLLKKGSQPAWKPRS